MIRLEGIGPGDDTFIVGLFTQHAGKSRNIPIVRVGNIAAMPEEKVESQFVFLGLMHGHWDVRRTQADAYVRDAATGETINQGIAMVVPSDKITQVLNQPALEKRRCECEKRRSQAKGAAAD